ncbi:MAG: class I SAM-dependent methyltransferase [Candidatus Dormiibacterota bacterium]
MPETLRGPTLTELLREALSSTEHGYDLLAPKFDATPFRTPDWLLDEVRRSLTPAAPFQRGLDLCCGTGVGLRVLGPLCTSAIVGIDRSRGMLAEARRRGLSTMPGHTLQWVRGDALELPFRDAFDLIVTFGALGHIPRRHERHLLDVVWHALRRNGTFACVTSGMPPLISFRHLAARGFNAAMHVRNALHRPPFVMYYLTFLLPEVAEELRRQGYRVEVRALEGVAARHGLRLVVARRP